MTVHHKMEIELYKILTNYKENEFETIPTFDLEYFPQVLGLTLSLWTFNFNY